MILAIDVYYRETDAKSVGILFDWDDETPKQTIIEYIPEVSEYVSGQFYKRELPCIMEIIKNVNLAELECIIVDGHVFVDNDKNYGLGGHLWEALNRKIPIVGVAKKSFHGTDLVSLPILRGDSAQPLFVSAIGVELADVLPKVQAMKGEFRIPTLLKKLDQITKEDSSPTSTQTPV